MGASWKDQADVDETSWTPKKNATTNKKTKLELINPFMVLPFAFCI
jgi:hypothetical protein